MKTRWLVISVIATLALALSACGPSTVTPGLPGSEAPGGLETPRPGLQETLPAVETTVPSEGALEPTKGALKPREGAKVGTPGVKTTAVAPGTTEGKQTIQLIAVPTTMQVPVVDNTGAQIGMVQELVVDTGQGDAPYALVTISGIADLSGMAMPIPWEFLEFQGGRAQPQLMLRVDATALANAPTVDLNSWPGNAGPGWDSTIQSFWDNVQTARR